MLKPGTKAPYFSLKDIYGVHRTLADYEGKKLMISFYRYAACTFCNPRIAELRKVYPELATHNIEFLAFFQSPTEKILEYAGSQKPPFPIFPDPNREVYKLYGVEQSSRLKYILGVLNIPKLLKSFKNGAHWGDTDGDSFLIPADFLVDENQIVRTAYYGKDISDHLPINDIRKFVGTSKLLKHLKEESMDSVQKGKITMYGATWCGDCLRAKAYLDSLGCQYEFIDIAKDGSAVAKVLEINNGIQSIPTIQFPDGKVLVEPSNAQLAEEIKNLEDNNLVICHKQMENPAN